MGTRTAVTKQQSDQHSWKIRSLKEINDIVSHSSIASIHRKGLRTTVNLVRLLFRQPATGHLIGDEHMPICTYLQNDGYKKM